MRLFFLVDVCKISMGCMYGDDEKCIYVMGVGYGYHLFCVDELMLV